MIDKQKTKENADTSWNMCRKKLNRVEFVFIIVSVLLLIIGIFFDIVIHKCSIEDIIGKYDSYILTILGIQATVSTLTIALIALIGSTVSEIYMGVSVSDYYMNIRPAIFKQKNVIIISLGLIVLNCLLYIFSLYSLMISVFIITIILICLSAHEVYSLFGGLQKTQEEIRLYVTDSIMHCVENDESLERTNRLIYDFSNDWMNKCQAQTQSEYNEYKGMFMLAFSNLVKCKTKHEVEILREYCVKDICTFLKEEKDIIKARGIELLVSVYECLSRFINSDDFCNESMGEFNLFSEVSLVLIEALKSMPCELIGKIFDWDDISYMVSESAFCLNQYCKGERLTGDLKDMLEFSESIGHILKFKEYYYKEQTHGILRSWGRYIGQPRFYLIDKISENLKNEYSELVCKNYFFYCKGFIDNKYMDIIKENVFFFGISNLYYNINEFEMLYYLAIDCYLYYLSEKESLECVDKTLKNATKNLLNDKKVVDINEYLLSLIERNISEYINLEKGLYKILNKCELFPRYGNAKAFIMKDVVREFCVFIQIFVNHNSIYKKKKLELAENTFIYVNQFLKGNEKQTKENLKRFYNLFQGDTQNIDGEIDEIYSELEYCLKEAYKAEEIQKAKDDQKNYINTIDESNILNEMQENICEYLKSIVDDLYIDSDNNVKWDYKFNLPISVYTAMLADDITKNIYPYIKRMVSNVIIRTLYNKKLIDRVSRANFKNDDEYLYFLKNEHIKTLIGNEYIFKNRDYTNETSFKSFFKELICIFDGDYQFGGAALKDNSIKINIKNVNVSIKPISINKDDYEHDENNKILYNSDDDIIIPFQEDEFVEYINNNEKLLYFSIEMEFITKKNNIGLYIVENNE